ncbi:MAG: hypothetical protein J7497_04265, partial [Chitinophagaceae bacterium]|nr:hypothetical protein [Chitinophagaceae bacterium]
MISNYENIITAICERFQNHITPLKVVSWLENFEKVDWNKALITLNAFEYYNTKDIIKEFDAHLEEIIEKLPRQSTLYAIPVGKPGKSGLAMIYYLRKTIAFNKNKVKILEDLASITAQDSIVLVDDFSGSGNTVLDFRNNIRDHLPDNVQVSVITVAYLSKAKILLEKNGLKIFGNLRMPAFSKRGSVFGYHPKMQAIREFCFKYGNLIYPDGDYNSGKVSINPLGYENSQALIGFEHATPNNTLPIIWADRKRSDTNVAWYPIFPRRSQAYIQDAINFKKTSAYWSSC